MKLVTLVLISAFMGIGAIGIGYLMAPEFMYGLYGIELQSVNEANMVRAAYGGLFLGFALLFLAGALKPSLTRAALVALLVFMASFAFGRLVSLLVDGVPHALICLLIALEVVYAALSACLLWKEALPAQR